LNKLDRDRIAAFGLPVGRSKSAVSALLGREDLQTGPLNGWLSGLFPCNWTPNAVERVQVELIDTPGLDRDRGQARRKWLGCGASN